MTDTIVDYHIVHLVLDKLNKCFMVKLKCK